ncbi:MAG: apolipoprotein N-acyltransferase [Gammaproteobacteria bacterium]|nr:apolipoprotein N-acyltransferase [Gammaproteobacteria bacterium]MDH5653685.1 apolipoprotein N-acyltransferase [Gammaproteobacteria bacterium]
MVIAEPWRSRLLAMLCGALLPPAFAPLSFFPLSLVIPAIVFLLWLNKTAAEAARIGFWFGFGLFGVGVSWVYVAIHVFGYTPAPIAVVMTLVFVAFLALFTSLQGYVSGRLLTAYRNHPAYETLAILLILPSCWLLFEWVRGWMLTGFPWLNLGYSHIDSPLAGVAPIVGVYGVSALSLFSSALLLLLIRQPAWRIRSGIMLVVIWAGSALLGQIAWTEPVGKPLRVSIVQGNVPQITKWDPAKVSLRLDTYEQLTRENWDDSDLIFWPENSISMFYHDLKKFYFAPLEAEIRKRNVELIVGLPWLNLDTGLYYSSLVSIGATPGVYHKRHLVPFGEYVPLEGVIRGLVSFLDLPMSSFSRGERKQPILMAAGQPVAPSICYEDAFGEEVIDFLPEATLLINGSNNAWYGNSLAPHQHLQISRMRSLETGRMLIRGTTNGISAIVDHRGKLVARSPQFERFVLKGQVQPRQGATPYVRLGNWPVLCLLLAVAGWIGFDLRRRR